MSNHIVAARDAWSSAAKEWRDAGFTGALTDALLRAGEMLDTLLALHKPSESAVTPLELVADGAMTIDDAVTWSGVSRTKLYTAMDFGELRFIKVGKRRLIPKRGLRDYLVSRLEGGAQ